MTLVWLAVGAVLYPIPDRPAGARSDPKVRRLVSLGGRSDLPAQLRECPFIDEDSDPNPKNHWSPFGITLHVQHARGIGGVVRRIARKSVVA